MHAKFQNLDQTTEDDKRIHIESERERDREKERQRERERNNEKNNQRKDSITLIRN